MRKLILSLVTACISSAGFMAHAQVAPIAQSVTGRVICGYQGWFNCYGDGSPVARWRHWSSGPFNSPNGSPAPGAVTFEAYPDVSEYPANTLFQTALGNLNNGQPARLFSSYPEATIDLHFKWMQQYGIDGVALQRFLGETRDGVFKAQRDSVTTRMRRAAEKYQRSFYIMYDMAADDTTFFKNDWLHIENDLRATQSPYYAHQNGKPVICIWGFGFNHRLEAPAASLAIINWLKAKGYYVIGGVPTHWREGTGDSYASYSQVYKAFDMISPWSVGRFKENSGADDFRNNQLQPDLTFCNANNLAYQPVIFSGFAWSNWNGGPRNDFRRNKGEFFWRQLYNIKNLGMNTAYIAMFDEYDEGTNILKMADSYLSVPNNQYFLTSSAEGEYLSSDFYLRLAGQATKVLKGAAPLTTNVSIPFSNGPVWFRTSVETDYDAVPTWTNSADPSSVPRNIGTPLCGTVTGETSHSGNTAIRISGADNAATGGSYHYFRVFDVNIPVNANTKLSFWTFPTNNISRFTSVDLVMTDGTTLRDIGATDQNGASMHPGAGHGTVNTWQRIQSNIGSWLNGKTIDRIMIAYDQTAATGAFKTYFDDIVISDDAQSLLRTETTASHPGITAAIQDDIQVFPQPARSSATIKFGKGWNGSGHMTILNASGAVISHRSVNIDQGQLICPVSNLPEGLYYVRISQEGKTTTQRLLIAK
ncbi:T9SS type A sorting domain-containing protein [Chitinophaga pendula]|uniref:T9SS type A sorting domain-containing protein n=1 Tax=Chitinophaga pendula TaxID=2849666 RepID=UPI001CEC3D39|nr:T9SS type A sorting domain-containing protein [Chitinophaga pendula]UCJ05312.1 T9SS type A sorting domain-containing protein [Chitinophaga pendula]